MECPYCYYLKAVDLYGGSKSLRMSEEVLEAYTRQYIDQGSEVVQFAWHGGEPTLRGLPFFEKAVRLQEKYRGPGQEISNIMQTNGLVLDDKWCQFFRRHGFLIGLSIDGAAEHHDRCRPTVGGGPTHDKVMRALRLLKVHGVEFNALVTVNSVNVGDPVGVYRFLQNHGVRFMQFIPILPRDGSGQVDETSISGEQYGDFLCGVFDEWIRRDVGEVFVQWFEETLNTYMGNPASLCVMAKTCGRAMVIEHNGDVYSCDHFVRETHRIGNINDTPLTVLADSPQQIKFGQDKQDKMPPCCRKCEFLFACNGGCLKDRILTDPEGNPGLNWFCAGYKRFFAHSREAFEKIRELLETGQPATDVMKCHQPRTTPRRPKKKRRRRTRQS